MNVGNVFSDVPHQPMAEHFVSLLTADGLRIERIVSRGHASAPGFWYDQDQHEWILLLRGDAALEFEGEGELVVPAIRLALEHPSSPSASCGLDRPARRDCVVGSSLRSLKEHTQGLREATRVAGQETLDMPHHLGALKRCFAGDQFAASSGVELVELRPGFAKARLEVQPRHLNSVGIVQGGAIFTLADFAFAVACNSSGRVAVAVNMNLSCMKAIRSGTLQAEAREVSRSKRISTCTVDVTNEKDELVALFQGTAYIKDEPFPPENCPHV